jgi:hypothetical protein
MGAPVKVEKKEKINLTIDRPNKKFLDTLGKGEKSSFVNDLLTNAREIKPRGKKAGNSTKRKSSRRLKKAA